MAKKKDKLNLRQEMFCRLYTGGGEFFGKQVWSYIIAYKINIPIVDYKLLTPEQKVKYDIASVNASVLIRNHKIKNRCDKLLDNLLKNEIVDRELVKVVMQSNDLSAKVQAIREYNKLKSRVTENINIKQLPIINLNVYERIKPGLSVIS